jgi:hypothetical protein
MPSTLTARAQTLLRALWTAYENNNNLPVRLGDVHVSIGVHSFPNTSNFRQPAVRELESRGYIGTVWNGHDWADTLVEPLRRHN